jgi:hypothetical protein
MRPHLELTMTTQTADGPPLARGERVLAAARDAAGTPVVATTFALYRRDDEAWQRLGWEQAGRVSWDPRLRALRLTSLVPRGAPDLTVGFARRTPIVAVARERVAATMLVSERVALGNRASAVLTARRRPGSAQLTWLVAVDGGVDADGAELDGWVLAAIRRLRAEAGI